MGNIEKLHENDENLRIWEHRKAANGLISCRLHWKFSNSQILTSKIRTRRLLRAGNGERCEKEEAGNKIALKGTNAR